MRWLIGFVLLLLALGTLRTVGCGDESPCGNCDDGNPCTRDWCHSYDPDAPMHCAVVHECANTPVDDGTPCGSGKVCVRGVCGENLCEGVDCDDRQECTQDECDYVVGSCIHHNIYGAPCEVDGLLGICSNVGSCEVGGDPCTADERFKSRCNPVEEVWLQECRKLGTAKEPAYQWVNVDKCDPVCQQDSEGAHC